MRELYTNLWSYWRKPGYVICITTNGFVKANGDAVMGRGCAAECVKLLPFIQGTLGHHIKQHGNVAGYLFTPDSPYGGLATFPVKHKWFEQADLELIKQSTAWLHNEATVNHPEWKYLLPRPGCGNGKLKYEDVRPLLINLPDNVAIVDYAERPYWKEQE